MTRIISIVGGLQPSAPTIGTATAGDTTASVAFTPSTYIGKGTITYTATSSPGGFTGTSASSPITVSGLTNGTAYTFTVVGNTNYGVASAASAASNSITPAVSTAFNSIQTISVGAGGASYVEFTSIPQTYTHLQIRAIVRASSGSVSYEQYQMRVGSGGSVDSGSNYFYHLMGFGDGVVNPPASYGYTTRTEMGFGWGTGNTAAGQTFGAVVGDIIDYSNTSKNKVFKSLSGASSASTLTYQGSLYSGAWASTNAIDTIRIFSGYGQTIAQHSEFALYGIKA